jgi:CRP-like cAMP-binding protein
VADISTDEGTTAARRLRMAPVFAKLDLAVLEKIARGAVFRRLKKGAHLWKQGQLAPELAFVWEGELRVVRRGSAGVTFRSVPINQVIGFSNAIGGTPCSVDVDAALSTRVMLVAGETLRSLIPKHPEIAFQALGYMGDLVARLSDEVELLHHADLRTRLLVRLGMLSEGRREIEITHQALATQVGARRETVTRMLLKLERAGAIVCGHGRIAVLELDRARSE